MQQKWLNHPTAHIVKMWRLTVSSLYRDWESSEKPGWKVTTKSLREGQATLDSQTKLHITSFQQITNLNLWKDLFVTEEAEIEGIKQRGGGRNCYLFGILALDNDKIVSSNIRPLNKRLTTLLDLKARLTVQLGAGWQWLACCDRWGNGTNGLKTIVAKFKWPW